MLGIEEKGKVHFMGITGSGASAAAAIAQAQDYQVTGCDIAAHSEYRHELDELSIPVESFHNPNHLEKVQYLVLSPAILLADPENQEIVQAKQRGIPVMTWQEFVGKILQKDKYVIAVAGTHGKSTTTAMTALILEAAELDPTVILGAVVPQWNRNYRIGGSDYFVIEADEYNDNFLYYTPTIGAITNIEFDHPEHFPNQQTYRAAFQQFASQVKKDGVLLVSAQADAQIASPIKKVVSQPSPIPLKLIGDFHKENAAMAEAIAALLKVDHQVVEKTLADFTGLARRFSLAGEVNDIKIFDDYAHHPTALLKTCQAARQAFPDAKIWVVFQPHMFTRTQALLAGFAQSLQEAPVSTVIIADIYASREHDTGKISAQDIVAATQKESVIYAGNMLQVEIYLKEHVHPHDIIINMGAGDITLLSQELLKSLKP